MSKVELNGMMVIAEWPARLAEAQLVSFPLEACYADDGAPIRCPYCGHANFKEKMHGSIDFGVVAGPATEIEYFCGACGESVAYWAYGGFDPSYYDPKEANG